MKRTLADLPREHPAHPYEVLFFYRRRYIGKTYVRASSPRRAMVTGREFFGIGRRKKPAYDDVKAAPSMPVELNAYWGYVNYSNPQGLKLEDYEEKQQELCL